MASCTYTKKDGTGCKHQALPDSESGVCIFHEDSSKKDAQFCQEAFSGLIERGECDFEGFHLFDVTLRERFFEKALNFTSVVFQGSTSFQGVNFRDTVTFTGAHFKGSVDFGMCRFKGTADFRWVIFEEAAIFTGALFGETADFRMSRFDKDCNFGEVLFNGTADFRWLQFGGYTYFWSATLRKEGFFWMAKFQQNANFSEMKFLEECSFKDAVFEGDLNFEQSKFYNDAIFTRMKGQGEVTFTKSHFERGAFFANSVFTGAANFDYCHFLENGIFQDGSFKAVSFVDAFFEKRGSFKDCEIGFGNFRASDLRYVKFDGVGLANIIFEDANLEDCYISRGNWRIEEDDDKEEASFFKPFIDELFSSPFKVREEREMLKGKRICSHCGTVDLHRKSFCESCLRRFVPDLDQEFKCPECQGETDFDLLMNKHCPSCKIKFAGHKKWEYNKPERMLRVENVYREVKKSLEREGAYETAGEFFINEMYMKRIRYWERLKKPDPSAVESRVAHQVHKNRFYYGWRWLKNNIVWSITGYGEKPLRTIATAIFIIFAFALTFAAFDAIQGHDSDGNELSMKPYEYLYFSMVTFTTLGYGDYSPRREWYFQLAATSEAFFGALMMALFVFVFTRKMTR